MILQRDRHKEAVDYALNILCSSSFIEYIERIYLFGSYARKQSRYTSDVDLLVQCNDKISPEIARKMRIAVMPEVMDLPEIDLKFVKNCDWEKREDQFSRNLAREGVLLWKRK